MTYGHQRINKYRADMWATLLICNFAHVAHVVRLQNKLCDTHHYTCSVIQRIGKPDFLLRE